MTGAKTLRDAAERVGREDSVFFSEHFMVPRPLMRAITTEEPPLLLIDEVDKSDPEFEAFLLEVLSDFQVTVPEIGTIRAKRRPLVFLTSNNAREMSDALKRRCLHLYIDYPSQELEQRILETKVPEASKHLVEDLVAMMHRLRQLDLKKTPSISETLDWARALLALNATELDAGPRERDPQRDPQVRGRRAQGPGRALEAAGQEGGRGARRGPAAPPAPDPAAVKKGVLH